MDQQKCGLTDTQKCGSEKSTAFSLAQILHKRQPTQRYLKYLQSEAWAFLREKVLIRDRYTCQDCGSHDRLQAHHLTYKRLYNEALSDLITLCRPCHQRRHNRPIRPKDHVPRIRSQAELRLQQRAQQRKQTKKKKRKRPKAPKGWRRTSNRK